MQLENKFQILKWQKNKFFSSFLIIPNLREASGKNSKPPVGFGDDGSRLKDSGVWLVLGHGKRVLDDSEDNSQDENAPGPALGPDLANDVTGEVEKKSNVDKGEDDGAEEFRVF